MKPCEYFREMSREPLELRGEGLFSQFDGTLEAFTDPGLLLPEYLRVQGHEIVRRLDGDDAPLHVEQTVERGGVVAGAIERAESALCF